MDDKLKKFFNFLKKEYKTEDKIKMQTFKYTDSIEFKKTDNVQTWSQQKIRSICEFIKSHIDPNREQFLIASPDIYTLLLTVCDDEFNTKKEGNDMIFSIGLFRYKLYCEQTKLRFDDDKVVDFCELDIHDSYTEALITRLKFPLVFEEFLGTKVSW